MTDRFDEDISVDFSKMDNSLEKLVLSIAEWDKKRKDKQNYEPKPKPKRVVKKLNIELIRQVLQETKDLQRKKNENH